MRLSIKAKGRTIKAFAKVKRVYRDSTHSYFGVEYTELAPEDFRFLFECLYGRGFTDEDAAGIEGIRAKPQRKNREFEGSNDMALIAKPLSRTLSRPLRGIYAFRHFDDHSRRRPAQDPRRFPLELRRRRRGDRRERGRLLPRQSSSRARCSGR